MAMKGSWQLSVPGPSQVYLNIPIKGFIKINFNGASKGNPGPTRYGVIFHDDHDKPIRFYADDCRHTINNMVQFKSLKIGMLISREVEYTRLQVD